MRYSFNLRPSRLQFTAVGGEAGFDPEIHLNKKWWTL